MLQLERQVRSEDVVQWFVSEDGQLRQLPSHWLFALQNRVAPKLPPQSLRQLATHPLPSHRFQPGGQQSWIPALPAQLFERHWLLELQDQAEQLPAWVTQVRPQTLGLSPAPALAQLATQLVTPPALVYENWPVGQHEPSAQ